MRAILSLFSALIFFAGCSSGFPAASGDPATSDARTVFCLSTEHRAELADAAVSLRLAQPGPPGSLYVDGRRLTVQAWRGSRPADFQRACSALTASKSISDGAAEKAARGPLQSALLLAIALLFGAIVTLFAAQVAQLQAEQRLRRRNLLDAMAAFQREVRDYLEAVRVLHTALPSPAKLDRLRADLETELLRIRGEYPKWPLPALLLDALNGPYGPGLTSGWTGMPSAARLIRADVLAEGVQTLARSVEALAYASRRPRLWPFGRPRPSELRLLRRARTSLALLDEANTAFIERGQWTAARSALPAPLGSEPARSEDRDNVLETELAAALTTAGDTDPAEAVETLRGLVTTMENTWGELDPRTLTHKANVSGALQRAGRVREAAALLRTVVDGLEETVGGDDSRTMTARANLGTLLVELGDIPEAISVLRRVCDDRERVLGSAHPSTLRARNNLAFAYIANGQRTDAADLFTRVIQVGIALDSNSDIVVSARNGMAVASGPAP